MPKRSMRSERSSEDESRSFGDAIGVQTLTYSTLALVLFRLTLPLRLLPFVSKRWLRETHHHGNKQSVYETRLSAHVRI